MDLHRETIRSGIAEIDWEELQLFFARGLVIQVDTDLSLEDVSYELCADNKSVIEKWMQEGKIGKIKDETAIQWLNTKKRVRSVVIQPWVLVQEF